MELPKAHPSPLLCLCRGDNGMGGGNPRVRGRKYMASKELKALRLRAMRQGWEVRIARSGHMHWRAPNGEIIYSSATPAAQSLVAHIKLMKKAGYRP